MDALKSFFGFGKNKTQSVNFKVNNRKINNFTRNPNWMPTNNTKKNNRPLRSLSISSQWTPAATKTSRRKTRRHRK